MNTHAQSLLPGAQVDNPPILVRSPHGGRPSMHFKSRGGESVWNAALSNLFSRHNAPNLTRPTLLAIGPYLVEARDEVQGHIHYRRYRNSILDAGGRWTRRLMDAPFDALERIEGRLDALCREYDALDLVNRFFPERLGEIKEDYEWYETFRYFINLVRDADWFPLDEYTLETAWMALMEDPENDRGDYLAEYMHIVPLPSLAPIEEFLENGPTRILYGLLVNPWMLEKNDLAVYGIHEPQRLDNTAIYESILALEPEFSGYEHPLCFLPDIARIYNRATNLPILDEPGCEGVSTPWGAVGAFTWDDAFELKKQWHAASPLVDRYDAFHTWLEDHDHFDRAVTLILQTGGAI